MTPHLGTSALARTRRRGKLAVAWVRSLCVNSKKPGSRSCGRKLAPFEKNIRNERPFAARSVQAWSHIRYERRASAWHLEVDSDRS